MINYLFIQLGQSEWHAHSHGTTQVQVMHGL